MPIPTCQHIKSNGVRCGSPALRGQPWCYFHNEWRTRAPQDPAPRPKHPPQVSVNNRRDLQHALNYVIRGLLAGYIGTHRAALALHALTLASSNLARAEWATAPAPAPRLRV